MNNFDEISKIDLEDINAGGVALGVAGGVLGGAVGMVGAVAANVYKGNDVSLNTLWKGATGGALFLGGVGTVIPLP